jgi:ABC-type nitrate/sulfonate/bicarbonate transport system substrate-binding protein
MRAETLADGTRKTVLTVVETDHHFLYLPFYYARYKNFFGYLPEEFALDLTPVVARSDKASIERLVSNRLPESSVEFALADPVWLLDDGVRDSTARGCRAAVVAGLITNAAFWAVDHQTHQIRHFADLGRFERVITYGQGTTSYAIASRIHRAAKKLGTVAQFVRPVERGYELVALKNAEPGTVALSPDPLQIAALLSERQGYGIDIALGTTPEYNNVLVTALITRQDVIDENPLVVAGIVRALQRATLLVRLQDPDVLAFARDHFPFGHEAPAALKRASDSQVFPLTLDISEAHWLNAARAFADAHGIEFNDPELRRASETYEASIQYYSRYAEEAAKLELLLPLTERVPSPDSAADAAAARQLTPRRLIPFLVAFTIGAAVAKWLHPVSLLVVPATALLAVFVSSLLKLPRPRVRLILLWMVVVGAGACALIGVESAWEPTATASLVVSVLIALFTLMPVEPGSPAGGS